MHVFFYGTLMCGFSLRRRSDIESFLRFSGRGSVQGVLYDLGSYPGMVAGQGTVVGELYEILQADRLLPKLDAIEGYYPNAPDKSSYLRRRSRVRHFDGVNVSSWVYVFNGTLEKASRILSGDYAAHVSHSEVDRGLFFPEEKAWQRRKSFIKRYC